MITFAHLENSDLFNARETAKEALSITKKYNRVYDYQTSLWACAAVLKSEGKFEQSVRLVTAARKISENSIIIWFPFEKRMIEADIAESKEYLGKETFNQAWEAGQAMTKEEALAYVEELLNE